MRENSRFGRQPNYSPPSLESRSYPCLKAKDVSLLVALPCSDECLIFFAGEIQRECTLHPSRVTLFPPCPRRSCFEIGLRSFVSPQESISPFSRGGAEKPWVGTPRAREKIYPTTFLHLGRGRAICFTQLRFMYFIGFRRE